MSLGLALAAVGLLWAASPRGLRGWPATWLSTLILGGAAALQLVEAGTAVGHQHVTLPWRLGARHVPAALVILLQVGLVSVRGRSAGARALAWLKTMLPGVRRWWAAAAFGLTAAALSRAPLDYAAELVFATSLQLLNLATLVLFALSLPAPVCSRVRQRFGSWFASEASSEESPDGSFEGSSPGRVTPDRWAWLGAGLAAAVCALLTLVVYESHPHVPDEAAYLIQARYLAAGQLWLPSPPAAEGFALGLMLDDGQRWYSVMPSAWPFILAGGVLLGIPFLLNPILAGLSVLLSFILVGRVYDRRIARISTVLLCTSPWLLFMGMSLMSHVASLVVLLIGALAALDLREHGRAWAVVVLGLAIGLSILLRPLEGVAVAILLGLWSLGGSGAWVPRLLRTSGAAIVSGAVAASVLAYNRALTGSAFTFPVNRYMDRTYGAGSNALGFGPELGFGWTGLDPLPGHGAVDVLVNAALNAHSVNVELFGWPIGSVAILIFVLCAGGLGRRDRFVAVAAGTIVVAQSFYWFSGGPDFGARYWFLALVPLVALTARGLVRVAGSLGGDGPTRVGLATAALCLVTVVTFIPWRAIDKYHGYRGMRPAFRELARQGEGDDLFLVSGPNHPDYVSAAIENPLDLEAERPIFAWDRDPEVRARLLLAYPDRRVWLVDGPTATGGEARITRGPVEPGELLDEVGEAGPDGR